MSRSTGLILISFCLLVLFTAVSECTTCYSYSGLAWPDQKVCPGSDSCCGEKDTCMPNRLCKSPDTRDNILVRGTCLSSPWDRSDCAQICVFNETTSNTGFAEYVFPRVEICDTNTYCCRLGSDSCCDSSIGKVYLDDNGILSSAPSSTSSTSIASSTETTSTAATTTTSSATAFATTAIPDPASTSSASESSAAADGSSSGSEALALKVGLGVGIPLAAIIAGLATWLICRRRRTKNSHASEQPAATAYPHYAEHDGYAKSSNYTTPSPAGRDEMHEMPARVNEGWDGNPRELMGSEVQDGRYR
ncbi:hypothetical protein GCG54_00014215 [Colletotrichum gloeosporioides]|uniref:Mid2 domain-containing protein n=1 Tax=Colletotrichum gloeosporioides TaxID=474922 RepID=A0A8H4CAZ2_COLGL|nr:uncharacterized protein GCG54_00014215 [Colletotrichum gloeosporioides]KAF3800416.1 hypothetical protein GCG54_00014215 [Colletotrichum gloeosporioides]